MPEYTFQCGGCGEVFSIFALMSEYSDKQKCPSCKKTKLVSRKYDIDTVTVSGSVKKGDDEIKVGHLAKRNSEKLSDDEKRHLTEKHNAYKYEEPKTKLPKGMSRMGKKPSDRQVTKKQRKRDPKRKKKK